MTKNEILNMPAGREMDALIADKIFGCKVVVNRLGVPFCNCEGRTHSWYSLENESFPVLDSYSSDMSSAFEIAEKLGIAIVPQSAEGGFDWLAMDLEKVVYAAEITILEKNGSAVSSKSAPLAICRAALLATMETE